MCERYVTPDEASLTREFSLVRSAWHFPANFNTSPTSAVPVIRARSQRRELLAMRWGMASHPGQDGAREHGTIHAAVETLATRAESGGAWSRGQRCIVPALGYYAWDVLPDGSRQPYFIHVDDQDVFGFAGLWACSGADDGTVTEYCTIITVPANRLMAGIHNTQSRMPAILTRETREAWLQGDQEPAGAALRPYADELMVAYAVSTRVDDVRVNDETLLEPLETDVD